jgi:hypothetical protein
MLFSPIIIYYTFYRLSFCTESICSLLMWIYFTSFVQIWGAGTNFVSITILNHILKHFSGVSFQQFVSWFMLSLWNPSFTSIKCKSKLRLLFYFVFGYLHMLCNGALWFSDQYLSSNFGDLRLYFNLFLSISTCCITVRCGWWSVPRRILKISGYISTSGYSFTSFL